MNQVLNSKSQFLTNYVAVKSDLWVRKDSSKLLSQVDSLILDIDGVILDVSLSFRVAISQTIQFFFSKILGFNGHAVLVKPEETQLFKLAGGFNNDWELTSAGVLFYLVKAEILSTNNLDRLRQEGETLSDFTSELSKERGGLKTARRILFATLNEEQCLKVEKRWNFQLIKRIFQELYGGIDYCQRLYGFNPTYIKEKGLLNRERLLLNPTKLASFYPRVAILTGRTPEETEVALERSGLKEQIPAKQIYFDKGEDEKMKKPSPGALLKLAEMLETRVGVYVGDVLDDLLLVKNANRVCSGRDFLSVMVLSPSRKEEISFYQSQKADIITLDVNKALEYMEMRRAVEVKE